MRSAPNHRAGIFHPMVSVPSEYLRLLEDVAIAAEDHGTDMASECVERTDMNGALTALEAWQTLHDFWPRKPEPDAVS